MNLDALHRYWDECEPRERALLLCGISFAGVALMVLVAIWPAFGAISNLRRALPHTRAQSAQLEALLSEVRALRSQPAVAVGADAPAALEESLAASGLKTERVLPLPDGTLQLTFADVPYATWSIWLAAAERTVAMRSMTVTAKATSTPGNADVALAIRLGRE
jgi:type II secretory pathway component PulM